jgi:hypothetical protein
MPELIDRGEESPRILMADALPRADTERFELGEGRFAASYPYGAPTFQRTEYWVRSKARVPSAIFPEGTPVMTRITKYHNRGDYHVAGDPPCSWYCPSLEEAFQTACDFLQAKLDGYIVTRRSE